MQGCEVKFAVHIGLDAPTMAVEPLHELVRMVQADLDKHSDSNIHRLHVTPASRDPQRGRAIPQTEIPAGDQAADVTKPQLTVTVKALPEHSVDGPIANLLPFSPDLEVFHDAVIKSDDLSLRALSTFLASELVQVFEEERTTITHLLAADHAFARGLGLQEQSLPTYESQKRSNRAFRYATTYHLTFSLFSGSANPSAWEIKRALDEYLAPFLESFSPISTFTIDTQVQLYASLSSSMQGPSYDEASSRWTLMQTDLSAFINAAEWPLSPSIGAGPTINFVLYVPSEDQSPLVVESGGTSWLIPQWGGVQIFNPASYSSENGTLLDKHALEPVMRIFADQLDSMLGLPQSPPSLPLRLSSLARERTASLILSASSTLGALARLTLKLTAIAIPDNVARSVTYSIQNLEQACDDIGKGRFDKALEHARSAESHAEQAFFDPSMVGQVYFPDEHKVAVYVPLLGPMAVPLVMAAIKEIKKMRQARTLGH